MIITTQDFFSDYEIVRTLDIVKGSTVRTRHLGKDILANLRSLVGGEIPEYTKMLAESREQAYDRMIDRAKQLDANGIVCVRFTTAAVMRGAAEILVIGTAVKIKRKSP